MREFHERHLRVISSIDDEILSRADKKRASFLEEKKSRRARLYRTVIGTVAGVLAASILLIVLLPLFAGSVPVYRGMSVSGMPTVAAYRETDGHILSRTHESELHLAGEGEGNNGNNGNNGNHYGNENGNGNNNGHSHPDNDLSPIGNTYYATPGEDVLIRVHIDNPSNFEILSFTLNGEKYSSYMFEPGSTMQTLILKVNVGEAEGFREFTIDAIKYVDGEKIKDVRMRGERTIRVGVAAEGNNLGTGIALTDASYTGLSFDIEICDVLGILTDGSVPVAAKLYRGDTPVEAQSLTLTDGVATVAFTELAPGAAYRLDVTATYDKDDGEGEREHVLASVTHETPHPFTLKHTVELTPHYYIASGKIEDQKYSIPQWRIEGESVALLATLSCTDEQFTILSATQTKDGITSALTDLSAIPVGRGESTVEVTYTFLGEEYKSALTLDDVRAKEELAMLYHLVTPFQKGVHDGIDIGCLERYTVTVSWEDAKVALADVWDEETFSQHPQYAQYIEHFNKTVTYLPVYALSGGHLYGNMLYETSLQEPGLSDLLNSSYFEYRRSVRAAGLASDDSVYVEAGTFLGLYRVDEWAPLGACEREVPCMHLSCSQSFVGAQDPLPALRDMLSHRPNSGTVTKEPTCTTAGERIYTCTTGGCGATLYTEILPALGHKTEDTWQTDGVSHYNVCTRTGCGEHLNTAPCTFELIPVDSEHHAVCCTVCGGVKAGTQGEHSFADVETVIKEPTCTAVGKLLRECTTCAHAVTVDIPMTAHTYDEEHPVAVDGTHHAVLCTACDAEKPDSREACAFGEAVITPPSDTDCTPGKSTRTCAACGNTVEQITEPSAIASHRLANAVYDKSAKTVTWTCTVCDATFAVSGVAAANTFGPEDPVGPSNHTPESNADWAMCVQAEEGDSYLSCTAAQTDTSGTWIYTGPLKDLNAPSFYMSFDIRLLRGARFSVSMRSTEGAWLGGGNFVLPEILGDGSVIGGTSFESDGYIMPLLAPAGTVNDTIFTNVTIRYDAEAGHMTVWINGTEVLSQTVDDFKDVRIAKINLTVSPPSGDALILGSGMHLDNVIVAYGADAAVKLNGIVLDAAQ